jgi:hypothetical protein
LWEPAVYECRVGVDSGVETLSGGRRPTSAIRVADRLPTKLRVALALFERILRAGGWAPAGQCLVL